MSHDLLIVNFYSTHNKQTQVTGVYSHLSRAHRASGESLVESFHIFLCEPIIPPLHHHLTARVRIRGRRVYLAARSRAASHHVEPALLRPVHAHACASVSPKMAEFKSEPEIRSAAPDETSRGDHPSATGLSDTHTHTQTHSARSEVTPTDQHLNTHMPEGGVSLSLSLSALLREANY